MGLDMYLTGKIHLPDYNEIGKKASKIIAEIFTLKDFHFNEASFNAGYWRKANHIHKWFVDNVQDGKDDCKEYYVDIDELKKLKELCEKVLKDNKLASELLPIQKGFFFGNDVYDEYYFQDVQNTIDIINKLPTDNNKDFTIFYCYKSCW